MQITYRQLLASECERISEIDASNFIKRAWREVNGVKQWVEINWQDEDFPDGYENHLAALKAIFEGEGFSIGAFDGERLIGFASVNLEPFGKQHTYVLLDQLFISREYKRKGIGKRLFGMSAEKAREHGADRFYICAGSSEDTLAFYASLGCKDATELNQALYVNDPNDVQLEYDLLPTQSCIEINTDRLYLRTLTDADAAIVRKLSGEFDNEQDALAWIRQINARKDKHDICFMFYIWLKPTNQLIGRVYFHNKYELGGEVEIGYGINEAHRNKGYATEAAKAVIHFAFGQAGQGELAAIVKQENMASRRVIEKLGFTYRGTRTVFDNGEYVDFDYFKLFPIQYRMAQKSDAPELKKINDLFNKNGANTMEAIEGFLNGNGPDIVCVAANGNDLVGFCCGHILKYMCFTFLYGEITEFFVMEAYRRQGIGKQLLSYTEAEFRKQGVQDFYVLTGQKNIPAQALYTSCGFSDAFEILFQKSRTD